MFSTGLLFCTLLPGAPQVKSGRLTKHSGMIAAGVVLNYITGYHRPFAVTDAALAYPLKPDTVSVTAAGLVAFAAPAFLIFVLTLALPCYPLPIAASKSAIWRRKLWDIHASVLGLALSCALTLFVTAGLKDVVGKPRPDLLARCNPDLANIGNYTVGGFGTSLDSEASALVSSGICRQTDRRLLDDGFASFPSGHSSLSWAGLLYLTLWLCSKLSIAIPYMGTTQPIDWKKSDSALELAAYRERRSASPVWLVVIVLVPCAVALYVCSSRYSDFHHAGFDIISGSAIGILFAWGCFRNYHLSIGLQLGSTWAARGDENVFLPNLSARHDRLTRILATRGVQDEEAGREQRPEVGQQGEEMITHLDSMDQRNSTGV